jgi:putative transposase
MRSDQCPQSSQIVLMTQAYRFALDPSPRQQRLLLRHAGAARFAYNWGLALVKSRLDQRAVGAAIEVPTTLPALRREWNQAKHVVAPWWADVSKEAANTGLDALARALRNFFDSRSGNRSGPRVGFPRFKARQRSKPTIRFTTGAIRIEPDRTHVVVPRLGRIKTHESTRKLARHLERGTGRIVAATVRFDGGRWYCSFTCRLQRRQRRPRRPRSVVGVDLGIRNLAILSQGEPVPNPAPLAAAQQRLRRLNRQLARRCGPIGPDGRLRQPSAGWLHTRSQLARTHHRVADVRRQELHRLTSSLAREHGTLVVETLNVAGMLRNRRLARALADASLAEIRRQLAYKTTWNGGRLICADRWYPSSKTCSVCGWVKPKLTLRERTFGCDRCRVVLDRDRNAARNLAALALHVAGSGPETSNARGGGVSPGFAGQSPMKREPRKSATLRRTGTVVPQGAAAWAAASIRHPGNGD